MRVLVKCGFSETPRLKAAIVQIFKIQICVQMWHQIRTTALKDNQRITEPLTSGTLPKAEFNANRSKSWHTIQRASAISVKTGFCSENSTKFARLRIDTKPSISHLIHNDSNIIAIFYSCNSFDCQYAFSHIVRTSNVIETTYKIILLFAINRQIILLNKPLSCTCCFNWTIYGNLTLPTHNVEITRKYRAGLAIRRCSDRLQPDSTSTVVGIFCFNWTHYSASCWWNQMHNFVNSTWASPSLYLITRRHSKSAYIRQVNFLQVVYSFIAFSL